MDSIEIKLSRTVNASPDQVFQVWLDAKSPGGPWFGAERVILQPAQDGLFYHCVLHEGRQWAHYGRFTRIEKPRVIEHTWVSEATKGRETIVTLALEPRGSGTEVTLRHAGVPDDDIGRSHQDGWTFILDAIAKRFEPRVT
jgi:uncharacterized protein YndB with AHSA1/START domain